MASGQIHLFSPTRIFINFLRIKRYCPCICHCSTVWNSRHVRRKHTNPWTDVGAVGKLEIQVGDNSLRIQTGQLARFADGCATAQLGDTSVMVTAVSRGRGSPMPFLPLTVDYRQKAAAAGRIPTNYLRRELGASDREILTSRMIDRSIRPLFPAGFSSDTQLVCNLLAVDGHHDPDIVSINAASAALALSDIPWNGPIGAVRMGLIDGEIVVNPTRRQLTSSKLSMVVAGGKNNKVVMLEGVADNVAHDDLKRAISTAVKETQKIIDSVQSLAATFGKPKREIVVAPVLQEEVVTSLNSFSANRIKDVFTESSHHKISRDEAISAIRDDVMEKLKETYPDAETSLMAEQFSRLTKQTFRDLVFERNIRCDGRSLTDIRPITCQVDLYKPLHGSALFQRGQTQVLCTVTFDSPDSAAKVDTISAIMSGIKEKNFFLHYEFPPYATNETGRPGAIGRRELGHGALAEKGLKSVVPNDYPFTIRLTAEVLESNGSSSMASVCAGSLALMDAGVPLTQPAAGVAVGLITKMDAAGEEITDHRLLTDLLGIEDYMGDMDFKMAGTRTGMTALQADIKPAGLPVDIIHGAVDRAADGVCQILDIMEQTQPRPRQVAKDNRPVTDKLEVPVVKRARFTGIGGHNLKRLTAETGVSISALDEGTFQIFAPNQTAMDEAKEKIDEMLSEEKEPTLEFGAIYTAKIVEIREYGVMVQLYPAMMPTLVHNSQLDQRKVSHPSALNLEVGQEISVKYFGRDPASGKMRLSRKVLYAPATSIIRNLGSSSSNTDNNKTDNNTNTKS